MKSRLSVAACERIDQAEHQRKGCHQQQRDAAFINGELQEIVAAPSDAKHDENLGLTEPSDAIEFARNERFRMMAEGLGEILRWFVSSGTVTAVSPRAITLSYVLRPDLFPDKARTFRAIAKKYDAGTAAGLSKYTQEILTLSGGVFCKGNCRSATNRDALRRPHGGAIFSRTGKRKFKADLLPK